MVEKEGPSGLRGGSQPGHACPREAAPDPDPGASLSGVRPMALAPTSRWWQRPLSSPDGARHRAAAEGAPGDGLPGGKAISGRNTQRPLSRVTFPPKWPERSPPPHSAGFMAAITFYDPFMKIFIFKFHKRYCK